LRDVIATEFSVTHWCNKNRWFLAQAGFGPGWVWLRPFSGPGWFAILALAQAVFWPRLVRNFSLDLAQAGFWPRLDLAQAVFQPRLVRKAGFGLGWIWLRLVSGLWPRLDFMGGELAAKPRQPQLSGTT
jgi:hypothetical protein